VPSFKRKDKTKQSNQNSKVKESKSVEVNVKVPITGTSLTAILLVGLLTLIGYAGYLGVNSVWKFTHPKFNISLDSFRALGYIAKGQTIPPLPLIIPEGKVPEKKVLTEYLQEVATFKVEFRAKFPNSKLLQVSDNEVINLGWSFCQAKEQAMAESGEYSLQDIVEAHQSKFVLRYPNVGGLDIYLAGVGQRALDFLCGSG